jgi:hypothetical protein
VESVKTVFFQNVEIQLQTMAEVYHAKKVKVFRVELSWIDNSSRTIRYYGEPCSGTTTEWHVLREDADNAVQKFIDSLEHKDLFHTSVDEDEILQIDVNGIIEFRLVSQLKPAKMVCLEEKYYDYRALFSTVDFSKSEHESNTSWRIRNWTRKDANLSDDSENDD